MKKILLKLEVPDGVNKAVIDIRLESGKNGIGTYHRKLVTLESSQKKRTMNEPVEVVECIKKVR